MAQKRKLLGMTSQQIVILAVLAVLVFVMFAIAGYVFLRGAPSLLAPQSTLTPMPTWTPYIVPTVTLTPTHTPVPYEMLIPPVWVQFQTPLVEIWLPKGFKKEKSSADDSTLTTELTMQGHVSESSIYPMGVLVSYEPIIGDSLDAYVTELPNQLTNDVRVAEKRKVSVNSVEAVRLMLEMKVEGVDFNSLVYIFQDGGTVWVIQYVAQINDYYVALPTFEQSIKTFRIVR